MTILVNLTGDVGYTAYKQTQLFRQKKFDFHIYPFEVKLHLHKFEILQWPVSESLPVSGLNRYMNVRLRVFLGK